MNEAVTAGLRGVSSPADRRFYVRRLITGLGSGDVETVLKRPAADAGERADIERLMPSPDAPAATSAYGEGFPNILISRETTALVALGAAARARVETPYAVPRVVRRYEEIHERLAQPASS